MKIIFFRNNIEVDSLSPPWWKTAEIRASIGTKPGYIGGDWIELATISREQFIDLHLDQLKNKDTPVFSNASWVDQVKRTLDEINKRIQDPLPYTGIEVRIIDLS